MRRLILVFPLTCALASCVINIDIDTGGSSQRIKAGSRVILTQDVAIPDKWARIAIQDGAPVPARRDIVRSKPFCELGTDVVSRPDKPQIVQADEFEAYEVRYRRSLVTDDENRTYTTLMLLRSERQPKVRRLSCERTGSPIYSGDLTIEEIRQALGDFVQLELAN